MLLNLRNIKKDINNFRGVYGYFYQIKSKNLNFLNKVINKKVQTLTYFGFQKKFFPKIF